MGFTDAMIGLVIIVIILAIFIPITGVLLPTIIGDSGAAVGLMVSTIVLVILASALFIFMRQSMEQDHIYGGVQR
jgi:hypothetical protein